MGLSPRTLRPANNFTPRSITGLALWLDASDASSLYTTDAGAVTAVSAPTEIAGCVGWWDASDAESITQSSGSVSQINDKSGLAAHASQGTSGSRPTLIASALNGRSILRFDGGDGLTGNFASSINTGAYSVFAVCKATSMVTNGRVFSVAGASSDFVSGMMIPCCTNASATAQLSAYDGATGANRGAVDGFTSYAVFSGVVGTSSLTNAANGMRAASASVTFNTAVTRFGIGTPAQGGAGGWNGDIAEVIYYSAALSNADRARVEAYLAAKWGISGVHRPVSQELTAVSSPLELSGCAGWWDASRADKMWNATSGGSLVADGGAVLRLDDLSGNGKHLIQATSAIAPSRQDGAKNGLPVLNFAGTKSLAAGAAGDWNFLHNTNGGTVIAVIKPFDTADPNTFAYGVATNIGGASNGTGWSSFFDDRASGYLRNNHVSQSVMAGVAGQSVASQEQNNALTSANDFSLLSFTPFAGSSTTAGRAAMYVSGTATGNTNSSTLAPSASNSNHALTVGIAGSNSIAGLAELIVFNTVLSAVDRARVEKYLQQKWATPAVPDPTPPVGAWLDKSGNARHATQSTAGSRPTRGGAIQNNRSSVAFAGSPAQFMGTVVPGADAGLFTVFAVARSQMPAGSSGVVLGERGGNFSTAIHFQQTPNKATVYIVGNTEQLFAAHGGVASIYSITKNSTSQLIGHRNAAQEITQALSSSSGYNLANLLRNIGASTSGASPLYGNVYELIAYGSALSASDRLRIERYLAAKWGITLAPQVSNADAQDWINRVYANGGTVVSSSTAAAVNTFCDAIDAAAIRDRFYRLNLFAGGTSGTTAGLAACLVPLYRGQSLGGTQYGNTTDTNVGPFVVGDYAETGLSAGSGKHLRTGVTQANVGTACHLAFYDCVRATNAYANRIGSRGATDTHEHALTNVDVATTIDYGSSAIAGNQRSRATGYTQAGAFWMGVNPSATSSILYKNGASAATATPVARTAQNLDYWVFALNNNGSLDSVQTTGRSGGYSIGLSMNATQAADYYTAMQAFQTAMGRNV